ncbi:FecR family protein [Arenibacter certesii]|uniref:FecR family protein n=1 Tax=Arenibacter certesii TaxID=228955 RepID=A0A918MH44_9FLAO|nr:FecR domain-containing protein [Arenibacter certesii]GGW22005.1 hypothetical protein GCM10007383_01180 [Arenibacter certesii]
MVSPEVEQLIVRFLSNSATTVEIDELTNWILMEGNQKLFDAYVQSHLEIITSKNRPDTVGIKKKLIHKIEKHKKKHVLKTSTRYAAVGLLLLSLGYLIPLSLFVKPNTNSILHKQEEITITLSNGEVETLRGRKEKTIKDANGNSIGILEDTKLVYSGTSNTEKLVYNTLSVPYGKQFNLVLSDGTQVVLNSGTSIRYPVAFIKGKERTVYLTGEAYFDVFEDKEHPFVVYANEMEIQVLGTEFNVSHYPENDHIQTVLVEGAVALQIKGDSATDAITTRLEPGTKGEWLKSGSTIAVENVDTKLYTAWTQGKLVFRNTEFKKIRQALERHYNVAITNNNPLLDQQVFDATFDIETIDQVLESFNKSYAIEYDIENKEVIIQ